MTEAEWLACGNPKEMLRHLRGNVSARKVILFPCACVWRVSENRERSLQERIRRGLILAEGYADGTVSPSELRRGFTTVGCGMERHPSARNFFATRKTQQ